MDNRICIIIGHYGSGKTEFSINYAKKLSKTNLTAIIDLDIVNPYFRSRDKSEELGAMGIKVISGSRGHQINLDIPMISSEILNPLQDKRYKVVLDVGGNAVGARILARYKSYFKVGEYDMFCVINRNRMETADLEGVLFHLKEIESTVGVPVTGLINNTHLIHKTELEDVLYGQELVELVSKETGIPIRYISVAENIANKLPENLDGEIFEMQMNMREKWMNK